jgi:hypothetical protein
MRLAIPTLALLALTPACSGVYAPPSRAMPLETARAAGRGATELQIEGGVGAGLFHFDGGGGGARVSHGVTDNVTASVEGTAVVADGGYEHGTETAYTGRAGVHVHPTHQQYLALTGGIGGGVSGTLGSWVTADLGGVTSIGGRYATAFLSAEGFVSQPIESRTVTYEEDKTDSISTAVGARATLGVELYPGRPEDKVWSVLLGASAGDIWDRDDQLLWIGLGGGVRVRLD